MLGHPPSPGGPRAPFAGRPTAHQLRIRSNPTNLGTRVGAWREVRRQGPTAARFPEASGGADAQTPNFNAEDQGTAPVDRGTGTEPKGAGLSWPLLEGMDRFAAALPISRLDGTWIPDGVRNQERPRDLWGGSTVPRNIRIVLRARSVTLATWLTDFTGCHSSQRSTALLLPTSAGRPPSPDFRKLLVSIAEGQWHGSGSVGCRPPARRGAKPPVIRPRRLAGSASSRSAQSAAGTPRQRWLK